MLLVSVYVCVWLWIARAKRKERETQRGTEEVYRVEEQQGLCGNLPERELRELACGSLEKLASARDYGSAPRSLAHSLARLLARLLRPHIHRGFRIRGSEQRGAKGSGPSSGGGGIVG